MTGISGLFRNSVFFSVAGDWNRNPEKTTKMSVRLYLKQAIIEVERQWGNLNKVFPKQETLNVQAGSHPELNDIHFLKDYDVQLYQSYIGILCWAVELGRVDLAHVAGAMARFSAALRQRTLMDSTTHVCLLEKSMMSLRLSLIKK
jgi:hypothetical protein